MSAAAQAAPDYIENEAIIAHTELLDPNSSGSAIFTTPDPGEHIFLCTFPSHYEAGMYGTLVITE